MKNISLIIPLFVLTFIFFPFACRINSEYQFSVENKQLKEDFKTESQIFIKQNSQKLSDKKMVESLDRIAEEYFVIKNKELAVKFIKTRSGVKRLNFLKQYFSKDEIKTLLKEVPRSMNSDTNYLALCKYCNAK